MTIEAVYYDPGTTGTYKFHGYAMPGTSGRSSRLFVYTDSVQAHAEKFGAFWTLDVIASHFPELRAWNDSHNDNHFLVLTFDLANGGCRFSAREDTGEPEIVGQSIEYTDLPHSLKLYMVDSVLMFPGDY